MKNSIPNLKEKIEENLKELRYGDNITELVCVLQNPLGGKIQVQLTLIKVNEDDEFQEAIDEHPNTPILKINGGKVLTSNQPPN